MKSLAIVTQGFTTAGGVQAVARWLRGVAESNGYNVVVFDLATSWKDPLSRRLAKPSTLAAPPLVVADTVEPGLFRIGSPLAEIEPARYLPRKELTAALAGFDVIQVVSGAACLGTAALQAGVPVALQPATMLRWERAAKWPGTARLRSAWSRAMTSASLPLERYALQRADAVLVHNRRMLDHLKEIGVSAILAPTGVDTARFHPSSTGWHESGPIVCVGRLDEPRKALETLIESYVQLRASGEERRLVLAGRGALPDHLLRLIRDSSIAPYVDVMPDVAEQELPNLLQGASLFAQSSREEGLGIAAVEAMACGLPVVATETAGTAMTVKHGETGVLAPQDDPTALATAIQAITPQVGAHMSHNARRAAVERFSTAAAERPYVETWGDIALKR